MIMMIISVQLFFSAIEENTVKPSKDKSYEIFNDYFGRSVTVTGLVTATDIIKQISDKVEKDDFIIIPSVMLKEFEPIFLDGLTVEDLSIKLKKRILIDDCSGDSLVNTIIEGIEND